MEETTVTALQLRQQEVAQYEANIQMYTAIANALPSEWPEHLAHLKSSANRHEAVAVIEDLEDVALLSDLWAHDSAKAAIRAEMVELAKAKAILTVLEAQAQA